MRITILFILCYGISLHTLVYAQESERINPQTVDQQFDDLLKRSSNYQDYKVVKKAGLQTLRTNINSGITVLQNDIKGLQSTLDTQRTQNTQLNQELDNVKLQLTTVTNEKDVISLFGNSMSKGSYQMLMWGVIGILLLSMLFFMYKFKNSNSTTREAQAAYGVLESEFEEYRKSAMEREQKMGRMLVDERNKNLK